MKPKIPYTCPRCEYKTFQRSDITKHFKRKNPCPCSKELIVLTEDVIERVLMDRVYFKPETETGNVITSNNFQQIINNYFKGPLDKLQAYTEYKNVKMITIDKIINEKYFEKRCCFEKNANVFYNKLTIDDLLQIMDELSLSSSPEHNDFNIVYDKKRNKISFMEDDGIWKISLIDKGLSLLLDKVKESFFDYYECYLIRKIKNYHERDLSLDMLKDYYTFIAVFYIQPITYSSDDSTILENNAVDVFTCVDEFYPLYKQIKKELRDSEKARIRKQTIDIIKRNSYSNENRLSTDIHNIFAKEEDFIKFLDSKTFPL